MNTKKNAKDFLRKEALKRRRELSEADRTRGNILMTERILGHQWFYLSKAVLLFASFGTEIDTFPLIEEALRLGKAVYLPRVLGKEMEFYRLDQDIDILNQLEEGFHGIKEPSADLPRYDQKDFPPEQTVMIMPGAAFDQYGNRIGYGGGFYDRFLSNNPALLTRTIGIGYRCQRVEDIPTDDWDIKPYQVILV